MIAKVALDLTSVETLRQSGTLILVVLLAFLSYGTARILASDAPGDVIRKVLEGRGWVKSWVSQASGVVFDQLPEGEGYVTRFVKRRSEFRLGGIAVGSPIPMIARFGYKLTDCPFCVGFHTSWIAWSLANDRFDPLPGVAPAHSVLSWWVGVFVVRGVQSFLVAVEPK